MNLRRETIPRMLEITKKYISGKDVSQELSDLLDHPDYQIEFERYNSMGMGIKGFDKVEYIDFFLDLSQGIKPEIQNERFKARFDAMNYYINHIDEYEQKVNRFLSITSEDIEEALRFTYNGLPDGYGFDNLDFIFSIGLGPSGGWFYKNCSHFDVVHFLKDYDKNSFMSIVAHEVHHIGLNMYIEKLDISSISVLDYYLVFLSLEGLAIKYCNNASGKLSKSVYDNVESNLGLDHQGWEYMLGHFDIIYNEFRMTIQAICNGDIKNIDELNELLVEYWLSPRVDDIALPQSRNYYIGSEVWGLIHDVYGKDEVFRLLNNLDDFTRQYNNALEVIGRSDLRLS